MSEQNTETNTQTETPVESPAPEAPVEAPVESPAPEAPAPESTAPVSETPAPVAETQEPAQGDPTGQSGPVDMSELLAQVRELREQLAASQAAQDAARAEVEAEREAARVAALDSALSEAGLIDNEIVRESARSKLSHVDARTDEGRREIAEFAVANKALFRTPGSDSDNQRRAVDVPKSALGSMFPKMFGGR